MLKSSNCLIARKLREQKCTTPHSNSIQKCFEINPLAKLYRIHLIYTAKLAIVKSYTKCYYVLVKYVTIDQRSTNQPYIYLYIQLSQMYTQL